MSSAFSLRSVNAGVEDAGDGVVAAAVVVVVVVVADDENHSFLVVVHDGRCREEEADDADGNGNDDDDDDDDDVNGRLRLPPRRITFLPICPKTILPIDAALHSLACVQSSSQQRECI